MPTVEDCQKCTKPCPQAKLAHDTALGRMYATNELTALLRKVECGQLVEVVRCGECENWRKHISELFGKDYGYCRVCMMDTKKDHFCSYGERKDGEG